MNDDLLSKYYKIASSSTSRRIIFLLGENGTYKATELIEKLDVSPGTFYDALKKLQGIVEKSDDGKYKLTQVGKKIYFLLLEESKGIQSIPSSLASLVFSVPIVFPIPLMRIIEKLNKPSTISVILLFLLLSLPSLAVSRLIPVALFMMPPYVSIDLSQQLLFVSINLFFVVSISYFLGNIFGFIKDTEKFCLAVLFSFLPVVLFSLIYFALYNTFFITIGFLTYFIIYLFPMFFSFTMLTTGIFYFGNIRIESAFMISLIILLLSFVGTQILYNVLFIM
ncbi:MAG TPA: winged helix-turn-helix transcriptional regulator [Geobacterales bacterium]|nr:winged helix-turn-helix transcriptional regulator [Geobacterales bacterium]